jgi:hypothetical protein
MGISNGWGVTWEQSDEMNELGELQVERERYV